MATAKNIPVRYHGILCSNSVCAVVINVFFLMCIAMCLKVEYFFKIKTQHPISPSPFHMQNIQEYILILKNQNKC